MQLELGGRRYPVAAGDFFIGSGSDSTLVVAAPGVLARHAVIRSLEQGIVVVVPAEPGAEILVNGARLGSDPTPLMHGDTIGVGGQVILVVDPRREGATRVAAIPQLSATSNPPPSRSQTSPRLVSLTDGREYLMDDMPFVIGRDASSDVVVESGEVSRRHAELVNRPEGDTLVDLSSNGVWVNGKRVSGKAVLARGDLIRVATEELRYYPGGSFQLSETLAGIATARRATPTQASYLAPSEPPLASLLIKSGTRKGDRVDIRTPVSNVGRAEYNDVTLPDPSVSASHAKLVLREGVWMLSDLGSTNGTRVDDEPVSGEAPLAPGVTLVFGEIRVGFEPRDSGIKKGGGTVVLQVPLPLAAPTAPGPQGVVLGGGSRTPVRRRPVRPALIAAVVLAALLLVLLLG